MPPRRPARRGRRGSLRRITFAGVFGGALAIQFVIAFAILLPRYQAGEITIGDLVLLGALLMQLNRPFEMIGNSIDGLLRSYSQFQPFTFMWQAPEESDGQRGPHGCRGGHASSIATSATPTATRPVVSDVSFLAQRGRVNFLVGDTGSGKTTLFKLALKSLETQQGKVLVDGIDINEIARKDWYSVIGVVPQDIMLLNDTLATNIVLGRALRRGAAEARHRAGLDPALHRGPQGRVRDQGRRARAQALGRRAAARRHRPRALRRSASSCSSTRPARRSIRAPRPRSWTSSAQHKDEMTIIAITHRKAVIRPEDNVIELPSRRPGRHPRGRRSARRDWRNRRNAPT